MMLRGTQGDFSGRSAWPLLCCCRFRRSHGHRQDRGPGAGSTRAQRAVWLPEPSPSHGAAFAPGTGGDRERAEHRASGLDGDRGPFLHLLCKSGADACCGWIAFTASPVPAALCPKCSLTSASPKPSPQEQPAPSLCTAIFPRFHFCSSASI